MSWQFAPGEILTATNLNAVTLPWNAIAEVTMSAPQSCASGSNTALSFDTETLDAKGWHAPGTPTVMTPTIAGWYVSTLIFSWQNDTDYTRVIIDVQKNGVTFGVRGWDSNFLAAPHQPLGGTSVSSLISLNGSSDTVRWVANQTNTSAGANTVNAVFRLQLVYPT